MVSLQPLNDDEATDFLDQSVREFLAERVPAAQLTSDLVATMHKELRTEFLTAGIGTRGHHFDAILSEGERVGQVWFGPQAGHDTELYIGEINIRAERRREGHARAAVQLILEHARRSHVACVRLTVAQDNTAAVAFYESVGFKTSRSDEVDCEMWIAVATGEAI